ncbi:hypothetical protein MMPV_004616 [Pyropia vietnamensis]
MAAFVVTSGVTRLPAGRRPSSCAPDAGRCGGGSRSSDALTGACASPPRCRRAATLGRSGWVAGVPTGGPAGAAAKSARRTRRSPPTCTAAEPPSSAPPPATPPPSSSKVDLHVGRGNSIEVEGRSISFDYWPGTEAYPTVVYLPGFFYARSRTAKANALEIFCKRRAQPFLVQEYSGVGRSEGSFAEGTLTRWMGECVAILDAVIPPGGKAVLVGSGIGGWMALHVAQMRPDIVVGLVGVSADPDFTEDLLRPALTAAQKETLETDGQLVLQWGFRDYVLSKALMEDAKKWCVMGGGDASLDVRVPVRLIHGLADEEVPPERALLLARVLASDDVSVRLIKGGDHTLETDADFGMMWGAVCEICDAYFEYDLRSPMSG